MNSAQQLTSDRQLAPSALDEHELVTTELARYGTRTGAELLAALPLRPHAVIEAVTRLVVAGVVQTGPDGFTLRGAR